MSFFAFSTLKYGANIACGDVDGDGYGELLAGAGPSAAFGAQIRAFDYDGGSMRTINKINFFAFTSMYGATVGASDIESDGVGGYGDGYAEINAGRGPGRANDSELRIFDYDNASVSQKYAVANPTPYSSWYGLHIAGGDVDAGDTEEIVTAPGQDPAATAHILAWEWNPLLGSNPDGPTLQTIGTDDFDAYPGQGYGANVAVGKFE